MVRLDHVLDSWKIFRQDTIAAVEDFPAGDYAFRYAPDVMTFSELAHHILNAGHALTGMLLAGEEDLTVADFRERLTSHATGLPADAAPAQLAAALRDSVNQRAAQLAAKSPDFFAHTITFMDGSQITRMEMLLKIKEHELTHRAQLFACMRIKGLIPATTRRRMAKQAGK